MTIQYEAAIHEAGHAIAASKSKFHGIIGTINLQDYGAGEVFIFLSKSKLLSSGKMLNSSYQSDKDVVKDLAVVLCSGLVAERIAEEKLGYKANPECAIPDYDFMKEQLRNAGLSQKFDFYEKISRQLLLANWPLVISLAEHLYTNNTIDAIDVNLFIEQFSNVTQPPPPP